MSDNIDEFRLKIRSLLREISGTPDELRASIARIAAVAPDRATLDALNAELAAWESEAKK